MAERSQSQIDCEHEWLVITSDQRNGPGVAECKKCKLWLTHSNRLQLDINNLTHKTNKKNFIITIIVSIAAVLSALGSVGSAVLALPQFSEQINNIQVKIDSLQESIRNLYQRYVLETFCYQELKDSFKKENGFNIVELPLKDKPIPNSINVWAGVFNVSPNEYKLEENFLKVVTNLRDAEMLKDRCASGYKFTVTYVKDF